MNVHGLPDDVDDALYHALLDTVGGELAFAAAETVSATLAARRDAILDMLTPAPDTLPLNWLLGYDIGGLS